MNWTATGKGNYLVIRHESEMGAAGTAGQVAENPPNPSSGEVLLRLDESGRHVFSVQASNLTWKLTFTPITSQNQSGATQNERTAQGEAEALELLRKNPLEVSGEASKVLELDLPRGRYRVSWAAEGSGTLNVRHETKQGTGSIVGEMIPNPSHGDEFVSIHETGRQIISVYCWGTVTAWKLKFTPL
jgi:hypothetical protein